MSGENQSFSDEFGRYLSESRKCRSSARNGMILVLEDGEHQVAEFLSLLGEDSGFCYQIVKVRNETDILRILKKCNGDIKAVVLHGEKVDVSRNGHSLPVMIDSQFPEIPMWVVGEVSLSLPERIGFLEPEEECDFNDVLGKSCRCMPVMA